MTALAGRRGPSGNATRSRSKGSGARVLLEVPVRLGRATASAGLRLLFVLHLHFCEVQRDLVNRDDVGRPRTPRLVAGDENFAELDLEELQLFLARLAGHQGPLREVLAVGACEEQFW